MATKETVFTKDEASKKIKVVREFDAPLEKVWKAWTEREILDQWWAPKPWKAHTQSLDFRSGGKWLYYMEGPEGERHYCRADYNTVVPQKSFTGMDAFCDEEGNINPDMPQMNWNVMFNPIKTGTKVDVELTFDSLDDMNKIIEMGFQDGFAAAHGNLDEILAAEKVL